MAAMTYALMEPNTYDEVTRPLQSERPSYNPYKMSAPGKGKDRSKAKAARKQNRKNK